MFKLETARIVRLALTCLVVSVIAGSPLAGLGLVLAQALVPPLAVVLIGCFLLGVFFLEERDATAAVTVATSRTFTLGTWLLSLALLWFVTLLMTPQTYETVTASFNLALSLGTLAYHRWQAGSFWPSRTDGRLDAYASKLKAGFAGFAGNASAPDRAA